MASGSFAHGVAVVGAPRRSWAPAAHVSRALAAPALAALACTAFAAAAAAAPPAAVVLPEEDDAAVFDAPAPPTLPALTHRDLTVTFEYTAAAIKPEATSPGHDKRAFSWYSHLEPELPLVPRKWFIGAAYDVAAASVPGVDSAILFGNPEIWGRGVWSSVRGLSSGGGLGLVVPLPRSLSLEDEVVLKTARVVRPWDATHFTDLTLIARPWFDMRHVTGPFIFQLRQGIDWSLVLRDLKSGERRTDIAARATFYFGYRVAQPVGLGLELWEVYQLTEGLPDDKRAAFAISPSVRFLFARVQPAISVLLPIATPLRGDVSSYYAARLNVGFTFPTGSREADRAAAR